jgi:hypothetical protein
MTGIRYNVDRKAFDKAWVDNNGNVSAVARDLNISFDAASLRMKKWGYKKIHTRTAKNFFNEHYLDQINQKQKAFWLGFLFANSYLHLSDRRAHSTLVETDREKQLLFDLIVDLDGTHNIGTNNILLTSNHFANVLMSYGKGYKWRSKQPPTVYPEIDDDYQIDFIHGWIRGNSSCTLDRRTGKRVLRISSREPGVLQNIRDFLEIGGSLKERPQKNGWQLAYGGCNQIAYLESLGIKLPTKEFIRDRYIQCVNAKDMTKR